MLRSSFMVRRASRKFSKARAARFGTPLAIGLIGLLFAAVCNSPGWGADGGKNSGADAAKNSPASFSIADYRIGEPIAHGNLTVFPILSKTPRNDDRYITLDEGLKSGEVKIFETGAAAAAAAENSAPANPSNGQQNSRQANRSQPNANRGNNRSQSNDDTQVGGNVNQLVLLNRSRKPLYLMPGEIIFGGKQDRTIAQETIVPPDTKKPFPLDVYCVEHGRWSGRRASETASLLTTLSSATAGSSLSTPQPNASANAELALKAGKGEFIGSTICASKDARQAVQGDKDQGKVWEKVAETNSKSGVRGQSGDFTGNYSEGDSLKRLGPYMTALEKKVAEQPQIVGVAIAIDGKMDTLDAFESTPLFRQLWPKLLKSYALDAANASPSPDKQPSAADKRSPKQTARTSTVDDAQKFVAEAMSSRGAKSSKGNVAITTIETDHVLSFAAEASPRSPNQPAASAVLNGGVSGGGVHVSGFSK